jgi:hypothetical protein
VARRWNVEEENYYRRELEKLYVRQNKSIGEAAAILHLAEQTVFQRLRRLNIPSLRYLKKGYNNIRTDTFIPKTRSNELAEIFGILLGDGHISHFQVIVTLGSKEVEYVRYVQKLLKIVFGGEPQISIRAAGHRDVYLGSRLLHG